jgi:hypothetical protein
VEVVQHNDHVIALIFRPDPALKGTNFFTPPELALQIGFLRYESGDSIPPHTHSPAERTIQGSGEIAIIQSGSCEVDLYSQQGERLSTHALRTGDAIVMVSGGHAFRMLEETVLYLIKQGPYDAEGNKSEL